MSNAWRTPSYRPPLRPDDLEDLSHYERPKPAPGQPRGIRATEAKFSELPHLLSIRQTADLLGYAPETIRLWLKSGQLQGFKIDELIPTRKRNGTRPGAWRVPKDVIRKILDAAHGLDPDV